MVQVFPLSKQQTWELLKELSSIVLLSVKFQTLNVLDGPYLRNLPIKSLNFKSYLLVNWPLTLMYIVPPKFTLKLDISFLWKSFPKSPTPRHPGATETEVWYFWDPKKQTHKITVHLRRYSPGSLGYTRFRLTSIFYGTWEFSPQTIGNYLRNQTIGNSGSSWENLPGCTFGGFSCSRSPRPKGCLGGCQMFRCQACPINSKAPLLIQKTLWKLHVKLIFMV